MLSYLDAGTASMIGVAFAGGVTGVLVLLAYHWHRFLGIFSKKHRAIADAKAEELVGSDD